MPEVLGQVVAAVQEDLPEPPVPEELPTQQLLATTEDLGSLAAPREVVVAAVERARSEQQPFLPRRGPAVMERLILTPTEVPASHTPVAVAVEETAGRREPVEQVAAAQDQSKETEPLEQPTQVAAAAEPAEPTPAMDLMEVQVS